MLGEDFVEIPAVLRHEVVPFEIDCIFGGVYEEEVVFHLFIAVEKHCCKCLKIRAVYCVGVGALGKEGSINAGEGSFFKMLYCAAN